jgi:glutaminyl-tRNA synthetase
MGRASPAEARHHQLPRRPDGGVGRGEQPEDESAGTRKVPFGRELYIEQDDFKEVPPPKYFRLSPGVEVRLRYAYFVKCTDLVKDAAGNVTEVHCTYDPATKGGDSPDKRKVKATIHWVSAKDAVDAEVRLYDHLFKSPDPEDVPEGQDWKANLNANSLEILPAAKVEPASATPSRAAASSSKEPAILQSTGIRSRANWSLTVPCR